jgi:hypothetical protein
VHIEPDNPELLRIQTQLDKLIADVDKAGESGDIDTALMLMQSVDSLDNAREKLLSTRKSEYTDVNAKKLRVCDICGSFLSVFDSDKRLADHFLGKQHLGYQQMREVLEAIKSRRVSSRDQKRGSSDDYDRPRDRDRDDRLG